MDYLKDFLSKSPEALKYLFQVAQEWHKIQGETSAVSDDGDTGVPRRKAGDAVKLTATVFDQNEIDALIGDYAEATVKEKAYEYIKGFITGVMMRGI